MPLTTVLGLALAAGFAAAYAARVELRVSPRPALLTPASATLHLFLALVLVPASAYFYVFHGDWFLLYWFDSEAIPSAVALLGFLAQALLGSGAFQLGALLVRSQRETTAAVIAGILFALTFGPIPLVFERLRWVGTFVQFDRNFGLVAYGSGTVVQGTLAIGSVVLIGLVVMLFRVRALGGRS